MSPHFHLPSRSHVTVFTEIRPLSTGDKSLNVRQEYNINIGKISLNKRNITAEFCLMVLEF